MGWPSSLTRGTWLRARPAGAPDPRKWAAGSLHASEAGTNDRVEGRSIDSFAFFYFQGKRSLSCRPPMVTLVCPADNPRAEGLECAKTCQNYDLQCMSSGCVSGCLCPPGMVSHRSHREQWRVGSLAFSCRLSMGQVALEQRERTKQEQSKNGNGGGGCDWGRGGRQFSVADSAARAGKGDGGKVSGVHPDKIRQKHRNSVHRGTAGSKVSISRKYLCVETGISPEIFPRAAAFPE